MKTKFLTMIAAFGAIVALTACSSDEPEIPPTPNEYQEIPVSRSEEEIVNTQVDFALKFYNEYAKQHEGNFCISPLSVSMSFSMLANGAAGETQKAIIEALGFEASDMDAVNRFNTRLAQALVSADNTCSVALANSIWINKGTNVKAEFINKNKEEYGAEIFHEEFNMKDIIDKINSWGSLNTNGMIPEFLKEAPNGNIALLNATYFNGRWQTPFDKSMTKNGTFYNNNTEERTVKFMEGKFRCYGSLGTFEDYVILPYGNTAFQIMFILPHIDNYGVTLYNSLEKVMEEWKADQLIQAFKHRYWPDDVTVKLPRFEIQQNRNLDDVLREIGFAKMFEECDFSGITNDLIAPTSVQEAHIKVDESGTEAAALTKVTLAGGRPILTDITLDHPFAFIIFEHSTGSILFMGRVSEF